MPIAKVKENMVKFSAIFYSKVFKHLLGCGIFDFCLLSFPQNERKIYKLRQLSLFQFVYFLSIEPSIARKYFVKVNIDGSKNIQTETN